MEVMQDYHGNIFDNDKLDFCYRALFDIICSSPNYECPVWNHCAVQGNGSELQTDGMEFVYDDELFNFDSHLNESSLWNDSIVQGNGLLVPSPQKQEDSVKIEEPPCETLHDWDITMVQLHGGEDYSNISSETANTLTSCDEGLFPSNLDSAEDKGLRLLHLLTACAEATSDGSHELVDIMLGRLRELVSPTGFTMERVAYYLTQSLQQLHRFSVYGDMEGHQINSKYAASEENYLGAFSLLNQVYPYMKIAHFTANQSILEAIPISTQQNVHIIDFDIVEGMQWPPLMEALKSEGYKIGHLIITAVKWDDDEKESGTPFSSSCKDTGRRLCEHACSIGIPFLFQETELGSVKGKLRSSEDEIVIVNCMWELPHMFERSRKQLLEFLPRARDLDPAILTVGSGPNGIVAHEKLNFIERFAQCLKNLYAVFDSSERGILQQYGLARAMVEHLFFGPMMCKPINYMSGNDEEGEFLRVMDIPLKFGFAEGVISQKNMMYGKDIVSSCREDGKCNYDIESAGKNRLLLKWDSTPLIYVSSWSAM